VGLGDGRHVALNGGDLLAGVGQLGQKSRQRFDRGGQRVELVGLAPGREALPIAGVSADGVGRAAQAGLDVAAGGLDQVGRHLGSGQLSNDGKVAHGSYLINIGVKRPKMAGLCRGKIRTDK